MNDSLRAAEEVVYIALGSNMEPRIRHMAAALHDLHGFPGLQVVGTSSVYASPAHTIDGADEPEYLNAVAAVLTTLEAPVVLERCLDIERALGRKRDAGSRWQRRTIDLDILFYGDHRVATAGLTVPHPRLADRLFVLVPLRDLLGPRTVPPAMTATVDELIRNCTDPDFPVKTILSLSNYV